MAQTFTGSKVILETPVFKFHQWHPAKPWGTPVLVITAHAGRHGNIAQPIIDKILNAGRPVYTIELKSAGPETKYTSVSDLVLMIRRCHMKMSSDKIDIVGLCQGGWLASIYTAKYPNEVSKLAIFAAPINTHTGEGNATREYCKTINMDLHRMMVAMNGGIQPGWLQWAAFAAANPEYYFMQRYFDLYKAIFLNDGDIDKLKRNHEWQDAPQDLAGVWFLDCLDNHFWLNKLYNGTWNVLGEPVQLSHITCKVFLYAGEDDDITHPDQVLDMANVVNSNEVKTKIFPGAGHTKVFVGKDELEYFANEFLILGE
jgi:poly(3-hydroxyalkanoate) synthetase